MKRVSWILMAGLALVVCGCAEEQPDPQVNPDAISTVDPTTDTSAGLGGTTTQTDMTMTTSTTGTSTTATTNP
jgi:hypothetical protein